MATFKGNKVSLYGKTLGVGASAPQVTLVGKDLGEVTIGGASGKWQIISVMPSIDTGVCQNQTRSFNKKAASLPNANVYCVSVDLPFALGRWCGAEGIDNVVVLSDFREKDFGKKYGLLLEDSPLKGLLTRAVIVVNPEGKIVYEEICDEITNEPNYEKALAAVK
ncbi:thiol peroxidase [Helicobacter saguini]|uniref:Thiol peroxidase n=1 Tax=Helicobacter saguini TaxID=1548018 RepID=A0A347VQK7_9HELI|nr:thiol peroxidase [Helicobacter saguini]MWV60910.1 thiol peroxidase [Helicobacter saguini]MWV68422.1 thiol peroxidase [Helicobacter saguini]MWV70114.1 thiol peroxidase [Helicobacter saguini]MWV72017.1 thiol peroxidase [Helicobacter saguini]TLD93759.1 thiol peroxidase [Helicobacter saguini]